MRRCVLLLLAASSLALAPAPRPKPGPSEVDLKRLQGTWIGQGDLVARFKGDTLTYYRGGELVTQYRITLNASMRPRSMDLVGIGGGAKDGRRYFCIYELDGDRLLTACNGWDEGRPTAFEGKGKGRAVEPFQREKN
jgi:uncharacterized protein (TIGR03067 family)